ncbi:MAG: ABC transporter substrate-binding protein [Gammaproteobacteria bacterium]|nr:ABC transporter substrate-binding protein [Gammaproteobacteria bacterium]
MCSPVRGWLLLLCLCLPLAVQAAIGPQELVQQTTEQTLSRLRSERVALQQNPDGIYDLVKEVITPHFDFVRISAWVLGKHWRTASKEQKLRFVRAFRTLLVRTYGVALLDYTEQEVRYLPLRDDPANGDVIVRSEVIQPNGDAVSLNYRLYQRNEMWKVYDISVDGISLVTNFRTSFATEIKQSSLDGLIQRLEDKVAVGGE